MAESLYVPLIALSMLVAYRLLDRPGAVPAIGLGAVIGLATLTRSDALLLVPLLVLPLAYRLGRARLPLLAVCLLATALVLSPWLANWLVPPPHLPPWLLARVGCWSL